MGNQCYKCQYRENDKERDVVIGCVIAKAKGDNSILILGKKGICPYHEYPEYYGFK